MHTTAASPTAASPTLAQTEMRAHLHAGEGSPEAVELARLGGGRMVQQHQQQQQRRLSQR